MDAARLAALVSRTALPMGAALTLWVANGISAMVVRRQRFPVVLRERLLRAWLFVLAYLVAATLDVLAVSHWLGEAGSVTQLMLFVIIGHEIQQAFADLAAGGLRLPRRWEQALQKALDEDGLLSRSEQVHARLRERRQRRQSS